MLCWIYRSVSEVFLLDRPFVVDDAFGTNRERTVRDQRQRRRSLLFRPTRHTKLLAIVEPCPDRVGVFADDLSADISFSGPNKPAGHRPARRSDGQTCHKSGDKHPHGRDGDG